ncbi:spermidine/putrescine ABC transporter substrate-binding protein [Nitriliruptoraceae bacterium ZYF776]|nr:spermidine/putrescine ABC transporter substrate-binding protein [Profundirhabdus halotolerans]
MATKHWTAVLVVGAVALAGCGREVGGDGGEAAGDDGGDGGTPVAAAGCEPGETDGDLLLYNWSEYMDPELLTAFSEEYGVGATEDTYTSNEALLAQIRAGAAGYDVIIPSDYMVAIMIEQDLLLPLDHEALTNLGNVDEEFTEPPYDPDLAFSVPYQWGTTGLGLNTSVVGDDPEATWAWLFDESMAGDLRVSMLDDPRETMGAALYYLGHDPNTTDEAQLEEAAELIADAGDWTRTYTSDQYAELLLAGETDVAHGFSGNILDNIAEEEEDYVYVIPDEGATVWTDNMAILADAPHPCTAHTFIDFILDAENGAQLSNWTYYASPNEAAMEFLDPELAEDPVIFPDDETWERLYFLENTGETEILYTDLFTRAQG